MKGLFHFNVLLGMILVVFMVAAASAGYDEESSVAEDGGEVHILAKHRVARAKMERPPVGPRGIIKPTPKKRVVRAKTERPPVGPKGIKPSPKKRTVRTILSPHWAHE